ncbi:hypothetical protein GGTG_09885 [Gaeumannomyces tritici R3-111a-1]|uniref:Uncharacterized protein n=1 Tax=Gaeumannomyces tritici (strain R3-111a-1) TaxID=644352 RepID=J3P8Q0_GAET3|nr:hypothetical protein GGTG_09885 [Gaeumannomyces tritici R3-111a-1]EJT73034.1 hypothetical protein GGTG_09885 [Gaeumannomyces tritici R3-111a-1]
MSVLYAAGMDRPRECMVGVDVDPGRAMSRHCLVQRGTALQARGRSPSTSIPGAEGSDLDDGRGARPMAISRAMAMHPVQNFSFAPRRAPDLDPQPDSYRASGRSPTGLVAREGGGPPSGLDPGAEITTSGLEEQFRDLGKAPLYRRDQRGASSVLGSARDLRRTTVRSGRTKRLTSGKKSDFEGRQAVALGDKAESEGFWSL